MILDRYLLRIWAGPFFGGLMLVMGVLLLGRALKLLDMVSDSVQAWSLIGTMLVLTLPYFLLLTVPMAFFLSMQNTIASLQQSSEMDVMRASGLSFTRMFRGFFGLVLLLWLGLTYSSMVLLPQGQLGFNKLVLQIYAMKGAISFAPQRFTHGLGGLSIYVDGERDGRYQGVVLEDGRGSVPVIYTAESARFDRQGDQLKLLMQHGVRLEGEGADQRMLAFDRYRVAIPVATGKVRHLTSSSHVTLMTPTELWHAYQQGDAIAVAEWNRRLLLPTTVIVLFFFALPLSLTQKRSGKAGSMIVGIALLLAVYNLQLMLHRQVSQGVFPGWTMWLEQGALLLLGIFLWRRAEADRLPKVFTQVGELLNALGGRLHRLVARRIG